MVDYVLDRQTLKREVVPIPEDRLELEIGDSKQELAYPQAKVMRWDNEVNLSVRRDNGSRAFRQEEDKIRFEASKEDVVIYELEEGLEVELHLKEKPDSNVFDFSIETKGLNFFYQPELTPEEIERGAVRPDNVVGSYAVYHATNRDNRVGGKHYKTGKFCHIYRPHVVDSKEVETWAELFVDVDAKILRVTVPQDYLDRASYPVIVDPTFGYTSQGASNTTMRDSLYSIDASPDSAGTVNSISAYVKGNATFQTPYTSFGLWEKNGNVSSPVHKFLVQTESYNIHLFDGLLTLDVVDTSVSNNTDYLLGVGGRGGMYETNSVYCDIQSGSYYTELFNLTYSDIDVSAINVRCSVYATYEEASTPGISKITSIIPDLENGYVYGIIPESSYTPIHLNIVSNDVSYSTEEADVNIQYWNGSSWATYPSAGLSSSAGEQFRFSLGGGEVEADITRSTDSVVNDASVGTVSWSDVNNAKLNDGLYASAGQSGAAWVSNYIKATNFGFSISESATIVGIKMTFERYMGGTTGLIADSGVKIVKSDGSLGTENKAIIYESPDWIIWPNSFSQPISYQSYGGETDLWGESWSASDINNSNFGVAISCTKPTGTAHVTTGYIDHIQITVYYTEEGSPPDTGYFSVYAYSK